MPQRSTMRSMLGLSILSTAALTATIALAQMDNGPKTEKTYGIGLPRSHASQLFSDADYPVFPLKPGQEAYKDIDGARMKRDVIALSNIALELSRHGQQTMVGALPRHRRRQRRHEVHDRRVHPPRPQGRDLPLQAADGTGVRPAGS